jgi:hypothetical protein
VVMFNLRHNFPSGRSGPKDVVFAIYLYSDGRAIVSNRHGSTMRSASPEQMARLFTVIKDTKIMQVSDAAITSGMGREIERRSGKAPGVFSVHSHREDWSELIVQHSTLGTNKFLRYGLKNELTQNPAVKELEALDACIRQVYETAGEQRQ